MKKIAFVIVGALCLVLAWYVFIRPYEFEVNFKAKTSAGDIIQSLRIWNKTMPDCSIAEVDSLERLVQSITWEGSTYVYTWHFEALNDSTTEVSARVSEPGRQKLNKILIPFTTQRIEQDASAIVRKFYTVLHEHLQITGVKIAGESETSPSFCVCRSLETKQSEKAYGMMRDYDLLTSFVSSFNLKANGPPIVRVTRWEHSKDSLAFDFCFPIERSQNLPASDSIVFREFEAEKALKAVYNGNYITSDRAWYELVKLAQREGYKTTGLPIEYFHNNPNLGLNESQWKAEVYLPVE